MPEFTMDAINGICVVMLLKGMALLIDKTGHQDLQLHILGFLALQILD